MPIWRTHFGLIAGTLPPISISSCGPLPHRHATGMPWMLPLGVSTLSLKSAWASSQRTRSFLRVSRQWRATALIEPIARLWSPPSRIGMRPAASSAWTASWTLRHQVATASRWR